MKIFSSTQIKEWDNYTITHEPVASGDLMERAAKACFTWLVKNQFHNQSFKIFCGEGNNGGDGLAISRMLLEIQCRVAVYILESGHGASADFRDNLERLKAYTEYVYFIRSEDQFPPLNSGDLIMDALYGTGLNRPTEKLAAALIQYINTTANAIIVSVDVPSGLHTDKSSKDNTIIKATYTLTFQQYKLAFMMAENEPYFGEIVLLDIHLHPRFYEQTTSRHELIDRELIRAVYKQRKAFSNKGDYGHACLLAGSYGMMGAAVLAARACLKSGVGKLTCAVCEKGYDIMQNAAPEAMCRVYGNTFIENFNPNHKFTAIGAGPGIGLYDSHNELLRSLFQNSFSIVLDADALNVISENKELLPLLPENCVLTPHPKEFDRLFGRSVNDFERMELAMAKSEEYSIYIVLKGHHTLITTPYKRAYFNATGNAGMAKGGSGDVLTGFLTGLIACGYPSLEACLLGVYLHGIAGDIASEKFSQEAMVAGDIIECLGEAFKKLQ